jgi:7-carboxy-7-deazaguanine synthase
VTDRLNVNEIFDTVQGEGPLCGRPATFLRLSGCNLSCSWCDTRYAWDWAHYSHADESHSMPVDELADQLAGVPLLVVTGGEPLLQAQGLARLHFALETRKPGRTTMQLETNGTRLAGPLGVAGTMFVVSPKLANAGDPEPSRIVPGVLRYYASLAHRGRAWLKMVVTTPAEVDEVAAFADRWGFPRETVWVLPEGQHAAEHLATLARVADDVVRLRLNLSTRLHLLAWPELVRGR